MVYGGTDFECTKFGITANSGNSYFDKQTIEICSQGLNLIGHELLKICSEVGKSG